MSKSPKKTDAPEPKTVFKRPTKPKNNSVAAKGSTKNDNTACVSEEKKPDPLASIRLVVQLKDGKVIERPMSEVAKIQRR